MIRGMRFPGNHNLHRHLRIVQNLLQAVDIAEQQRSALVGCKTPREPDSEYIRVQNILHPAEFASGCLSLRRGIRSTFPHESDQTTFPFAMHLPEFLARDL